jgi:hypothetical protein
MKYPTDKILNAFLADSQEDLGRTQLMSILIGVPFPAKCSVSQMPIGLPGPKNRAAVGHAAPTNHVDNCGAQH